MFFVKKDNPSGHHTLFKKVVIIGVGLMGGSLGMAIRKHRLAQEVVGICRHHSSSAEALKNGAVDRTSQDIKNSVAEADCVVLAAPAKAIISLLPVIGTSVRRGCLITDVGSTKETIVETASKHVPPHAFFVGSHPLAGSEKKGVVFSSSELFHHATCILTPTDKTNRAAVEKLRELWTKVGAVVKFLTPGEHDKILACVSHLPHLLAYGLIDAIPSEVLPWASGGLKDTTRIAASDPQIWNDICMTNSKHILQSLDDLVKILSVYRKLIVAKDEQNLIEALRKSKNKRDGLNGV